MTPTKETAALRVLFFRALFLRVTVAVTLHFFFSEALFAPDQLTYHSLGNALASYWKGVTLVLPRHLAEAGPKGYFYIVGALYYVFGPYALIPKQVNAFVGAWTVRIAHDLALRVTGSEPAAYRTAQFTAYFPSLILWSALNIRDAWVILLIVVVCREGLALQEKFSLKAAAGLGISVMAIVQFRDYILFPVTLPVVVSFFVRGRKHLLRNAVVGMLAVVAVVYADQAAGSSRRLRAPDLEQLSEMRYWMTKGAESQFEQADISTPGKALAFLPKGIALFLLAPLPWMVGSVRQVLAIPETLFFYSLLPHMFRGLRYLLRERLSSSLSVVLLSAGLTFGYALGSGNAGTAYRHRAQMLPCYLLFAAIGRERRHPAPLARPVAAPGVLRERSLTTPPPIR